MEVYPDIGGREEVRRDVRLCTPEPGSHTDRPRDCRLLGQRQHTAADGAHHKASGTRRRTHRPVRVGRPEKPSSTWSGTGPVRWFTHLGRHLKCYLFDLS